jgi:hypothetical protein
MTRKRIILAAIVLVLLGTVAYWFFMHTNRGSSWALYAFAGIRAPLDVKIACAHSTDARVAKKFQLPLDFTEDAKDALRGFWYYDYYRECLYKHGYDFSGRRIESTFFGQGTYTNRFAGFSLVVPASASLTSDNALDVDYDDHLYTSELNLGTGTVVIHAYLKDNKQTFVDSIEQISALEETIVSQTPLVNPQGMRVIEFTGANGTRGIAFKTPDDWAVYVFSTDAGRAVIASLSASLSTATH